MKRRLIVGLMDKTHLLGLLGRAFRWSGVLILNYHRVGDGRDSVFDRGLWSATPEDFDHQVRFCKSHFDLIGPDDLGDITSRRKGRYVIITFDDGYKDNYTTAFPILMKHRAKATFFISTGFIDNPRLPWWDEIAWMVRTSKRNRISLPSWLPETVAVDEPDREQAVLSLLRGFRAIRSDTTGAYLDAVGEATGTGRCGAHEGAGLWMTWDMVREVRTAGMCVGGHTVSHPILAQMPRDQQCYEVSVCGQRLEQELGEPMRYFSYPVGGPRAFDNETRECLRNAGVRFAFSYYGGFNKFHEWDDYNIRRIAVESSMPVDWFRAITTLPHVFARPRT